MANRNKRRGYELEKEVQDFFRKNGVPAKRVFGSGAFKAASPDLEGDVRILNYLVECKLSYLLQNYSEISVVAEGSVVLSLSTSSDFSSSSISFNNSS